MPEIIEKLLPAIIAGVFGVMSVIITSGILDFRRQAAVTKKQEVEAEKIEAEAKNVYADTTDKQAQTLARAYEKIEEVRKTNRELQQLVAQAQSDRIKSDNELTNYRYETDKKLTALTKKLEEALEAAVGIQAILDLELEKNRQLRLEYDALKFEFHTYKREMEQRIIHLTNENATLKRQQNLPPSALATV